MGRFCWLTVSSFRFYGEIEMGYILGGSFSKHSMHNTQHTIISEGVLWTRRIHAVFVLVHWELKIVWCHTRTPLENISKMINSGKLDSPKLKGNSKNIL